MNLLKILIFVQFFCGYGDSLKDYFDKLNHIGKEQKHSTNTESVTTTISKTISKVTTETNSFTMTTSKLEETIIESTLTHAIIYSTSSQLHENAPIKNESIFGLTFVILLIFFCFILYCICKICGCFSYDNCIRLQLACSSPLYYIDEKNRKTIDYTYFLCTPENNKIKISSCYYMYVLPLTIRSKYDIV
jgi:hypothetical protein